MEATVDVEEETSSLQQDAQLLCDKFAQCGGEAIVVVVNNQESSTSYQGSTTGMRFLDQRSDVMVDFLEFCKDREDGKVSMLNSGNKKGKSSSSKRKMSDERKRKASSSCEKRQKKVDGENSCSDVSGDMENQDTERGNCGKSSTRSESSDQELEEPAKIKRKKAVKTRKMDFEEDGNSAETKSENSEYLTRSSRKIKLPSWRRDFDTVNISSDSRGRTVALSEALTRAKPTFNPVGKYKPPVKDENGELIYECIQCHKKVTKGKINPHWSGHLKESGSFPCKICNEVLKTRKYLNIHDLCEHEGITDRTHCNRCQLKFDTCEKLIQHFCVEHGKKYDAGSNEYRKVQCGECSKWFWSEYYLKQHSKVHQTLCNKAKAEEKIKDCEDDTKDDGKNADDSEIPWPRAWSCHCCYLAFSTYLQLKVHLKIHSVKLKDKVRLKNKIKCRICKEEITGFENYMSHYQTVHNGKGNKNAIPAAWMNILRTSHCTECNEMFASKKSLLFHQEKVHGMTDASDKGSEKPPDDKTCSEDDNNPVDDSANDPDFDLGSEDDNEVGIDLSSDDSDSDDSSSKKEKKLKQGQAGPAEEEIQSSLAELQRYSDQINLKEMKCKICHKKMKSLIILAAHMERHFKSDLTCKVCGKKCNKPFQLKEHMRLHTGGVRCSLCDRKYVNIRNITRHYIKHHKVQLCKICHQFIPLEDREDHTEKCKPKAGERCSICFQVFKNKSNLKMHMKKHDGPTAIKVKPSGHKICTCKLCNFTCEAQEDLIKHVTSSHPNRMESAPFLTGRLSDGILKCKICSKEFLTTEEFALHQASHTGKELKCEKCGRMYSSSYALKLHEKTHDPNNLFECKVCQKKFKRKSSIHVHMLVHQEKKNFQCQHCGKSFRLKASLRSHLKIHNENFVFPCKYCEVKYRCKASLHSHLLAAHEYEPGAIHFPIYTCEFCGKRFAAKKTFRIHVLSHSQRKFKCSICSAEFTYQYRLKYHQEKDHLGCDQFFCKVCNETLPSRTNFERHCSKSQHIEKCKEAGIQPQSFFSDLEKVGKEETLSNSELNFDVISMASGNTKRTHKPRRRHCFICQRKFSSLQELFRHKNSEHRNCSLCNVHFKSVYAFTKHVATKAHKKCCQDKGVKPEAFIHSLRIENEEEGEDDSILDTPSSSIIKSPGIIGQGHLGAKSQGQLGLSEKLTDHQYQSQDEPADLILDISETPPLRSDGVVIQENAAVITETVSAPAVIAEKGSAPAVITDKVSAPVEVIGTGNDDGLEYVLIAIPNDSLTVSEDGTYLLDDSILNDVLK